MSEPVNLARKSFREIRPHTTIAIIGRRGSGKSTVLKNIMYYKSPTIRIPLIFSATADITDDFKGMVPPLMIYDAYDAQKMSNFIGFCSTFALKLKRGRAAGKRFQGFLVMDDIVSDKASWRNDKNFIKMFLEGRHFKIMNVLSVQNVLDIPPSIRSQVDYVIITALQRTNRIKAAFEHFWPESLGNFELFKKVLTSATSGHKNLFIDIKRSCEEGATFENVAFWCQGAGTVPRCRLGLKSIWRLNKRFYNRDHMFDRYGRGDGDRNEGNQEDEQRIRIIS